QPVNRAVAPGDDALVALDHGGHLLALVGMDDENDLVMPHALDLLMGRPPAMRSGAARKGREFYLKRRDNSKPGCALRNLARSSSSVDQVMCRAKARPIAWTSRLRWAQELVRGTSRCPVSIFGAYAVWPL